MRGAGGVAEKQEVRFTIMKMRIIDRLRETRAIYALADLGRSINALDDYMKALRLDDPMRDTVYETMEKMSELYDLIKQQRRLNDE